MNRYFKSAVVAAVLVFAFSATAAIAGTTYTNDFDDVVVTESEYFEFDIFVDQGSGGSATLTVRVLDVDEEAGELDKVYINNVYLGYLSGTDKTWSTSSFNIADEIVYNAENTVRIEIDPEGGETNDWQATIAWGQILVDGGSAYDANITSISASGTWDNIEVQTSISSSRSDDLRLEINLLDSTNNNKDIFSEVFSLADGSSTTLNRTVELPSEPVGTETFTIEANLFNNATGVQQTIKTTTWTYSADEPPTDIILSNDHVDENLPSLTLVGTLTAVDADSGSHTFSLIGGDIGSFAISGNEIRTSISFDYEGQTNYSIHVEAEDAETNTYSEWFTITIDNVNEAPTAQDNTDFVIEGSEVFVDVLANDTDPDNDVLDVVSVTDPSKGVATIQPDETIEYVPDQGACGTDTFSYTIEDGNGEPATASATITIQNVVPTAGADSTETQEDADVLIDALANDSDPGGITPVLQSVGTPGYGTAVVSGDKILYTPRPRFEGSDRFSYTIQDTCGAVATGWIDVEVLHTNHPPEANAGMMYQGIVGDAVLLSGSFSYDPDIEDTLQYRWDLDGDGTADTGWSNNPQYEAIFSEPFFGRITLEVRDLYRGLPTGEISEATTLVRIASLQSIQVFVFEDLDGNGIMDSGEPGLPGVDVTIAGEQLTTEADGGISVELDEGSWDIAMTAQSISQLESRGFAVLETETTVDLGTGAIETVGLGIVKTLTNFKGFVYVDLDENGEFNEDTDQLLQGLRVILDEDQETLTDDGGRFFFLSIPFGEHTLWIGENVEQTEGTDAEDILSLTIPFILERGASNEFEILWPWVPAGPGQGFLRVDVEKSEGN